MRGGVSGLGNGRKDPAFVSYNSAGILLLDSHYSLPPRQTLAMTLPPSSENLRIAIVDDHEDNAQTLAMLLSLQGMETKTAGNGNEAIELMYAFKPHCVLFDICMPGMDGLELAKRLRATTGDDVILLAMTGLDPNDVRVDDTFNLVDHYFQKPFEVESLLRVLKPSWT